MSAGFTPGPWVFDDGTTPDTYGYRSGDRTICAGSEVYPLMGNPQYYPWVPVKREDWLLIAAAPDMFEALSEMVALMDANEEPGAGLPWHASAAAALAKARGAA